MMDSQLNFGGENSNFNEEVKFKTAIFKKPKQLQDSRIIRRTTKIFQKFKDNWRDEFPWARETVHGVYCRYCQKYIRCKKDDLVKHNKAKKHVKNYSQALNIRYDYYEEDKLEEYIECPASPEPITPILGIDISEEVHEAIRVLQKKLQLLTSQVNQLEGIEEVTCMQAIDKIMEILGRIQDI